MSHPEERRIAGLLRELIVQSGTPPEALEKGLGWEPGRLAALLDGDQRLSFEDVLEILPRLGTTPSEFFAWLYGFDAKEAAMPGDEAAARDGSVAKGVMDRRFSESLRAIRTAIARRAAWKRERTGGG
jgi:hypothetical protein